MHPTPVSMNNNSKNNISNNSNNNNVNYDVNSSLTNNEYNQNNDLVLPAEPIALLALRGNCSFSCKAAVVESIHPSGQFLIVYNDDTEGEDTFSPLYVEEDENMRLILLSVSHCTGQALYQYIAEQPEVVRQQQGSPLIVMVGYIKIPPLTGMSMAEVIEGIGWGLVVLSWITAVIRFHIHCHDRIDLQDNSSSPAVTSQTIGPAMEDTRWKVAHALKLLLVAATDKAAHFGDDDDDTLLICPICLDDEVPKAFLVLPCQHQFHTECIILWLTKWHANCLLCKFNMQQYVLDHKAGAAAAV